MPSKVKSFDTVNRARAMRAIGMITLEMEKNKGTQMAGQDDLGGCTMQPPTDTPTYADLGLDKTDVHRALTERCEKLRVRIRRRCRNDRVERLTPDH